MVITSRRLKLGISIIPNPNRTSGGRGESMSGLQCSLTYPTPNKFKTCLLKNLPGKQSSRGWGDSTHLSGTTWKKKSLISDLLSNKVSSRSNSAMATSGVLQQEDDSSWDPMHGTPLGIRSPLHPITQGMSMSRGYFGEEEDKYLDEDRRLHAREGMREGDYVIVTPPPSKKDPHGVIWGCKPVQ